MIIHHCQGCSRILCNRIAGDDTPECITALYEQSHLIPEEIRNKLTDLAIRLLTGKDRQIVMTALYGID